MTRGIVINTGGSTYFTNAYVCVRMLRHLGCNLPIELWYLDRGEHDSRMEHALKDMGVKWVNASKVRQVFPMRCFGGWQRKPYSILHSGFNEVMLLDADIVPVIDPTYLWDHKSFTEHGCLFWPDGYVVPANAKIWKECGIEPDPGRGFQGGQQMVNVSRCRIALEQTVKMNEDANKWYQLTYGEQDLYRMAWLITKTPYTVVPIEPKFIDSTILEYDPDGKLLFQHRCNDKWRLLGNKRIVDFQHEELCFSFLRELSMIFPDWLEYELRKANMEFVK